MKFSKKALSRMIVLPFIIIGAFCTSVQPGHWLSLLYPQQQQSFFFGMMFVLTGVVLYYVLVCQILQQCVEQAERLKWYIFVLCMFVLILGAGFLYFVVPFI